MSYEAWRISYQSSEAAARDLYSTVEILQLENKKLRAAIDAMRVAGGCAEFQERFDAAKALIKATNVELRGRAL